MLHKTKAVVLKTIKYRETSIILTLYTEKFGTKTFIVNGVRTKKPKHSMAFFQPLNLLETVVYNKENANLNHIAEIKTAVPFLTIPYNHVKTAQALFIAELLNRLIREEQSSEDLFSYLYNALELFDHLEENYKDFHLQFLLKLSKYLGFDAKAFHPLIRDHIDDEKGKLLADLLNQPFGELKDLSTQARNDLLDDILRFYRIQTDEPLDLKTLYVFKSMI